MLENTRSPATFANTQMTLRRCAAALLVVLLLGVAIRMIRISGPPLDHHWYRQYETAALARNYYDSRLSILYPQIDWGGETPGYVESEFPAYPYLVGALYRLTGPKEWVARLLNIGIYVLSALLLFKLVRKVYYERAALVAVGFYSFLPLSFFFTRTIQGDALAALATLAGLYYFREWTERGRWYAFALSAAGTGVAILIKPSNLYLGLPLLYLLYRQFGIRFVLNGRAWLYGALVLLPYYAWYAHAFGLWDQYGNTLFRAYVGMILPSLADPIWLTFGYKLLTRLVFLLATPPGILLLLLGLFSKPPRGDYIFHWWTAAFVISMLIATEPHAFHDYYQLPAIFCISAFMARGVFLVLERHVAPQVAIAALAIVAAALIVLYYRETPQSNLVGGIAAGASLLIGIALLTRKALAPALLAVTVVMMLTASVWEALKLFPHQEWHHDRITFGKRVQELTDSDRKVVFLCIQPPRPGWYQHVSSQGEVFYHDCVDFYLSHRKGWSLGIDQVTPEFVESLRRRGAGYLCYAIGDFPLLLQRHPNAARDLGPSCTLVEVTPKWAIYRLESPPEKISSQAAKATPQTN